jgi:hypothetical protein
LPELIQSQLLIQLAGQPARAPLPRAVQLHRIQAHLDAVTLGVFGKLAVRGEQRELRALLHVFIEGFNDATPGLALAIVDLAQIQNLALHYPTIGAALGFNDVPVAMLLAVFDSPIAAQVHAGAL